MQPGRGVAPAHRQRFTPRRAASKWLRVNTQRAEALKANPGAAAFFATLDSANRYAILYRIADAKRPQTRARRVATFVAMLADHEKLHS